MKPIQITAKSMDMQLPSQTMCRDDLNTAGIQDTRVPTYNQAEPLLLIGLDNIGVTTPLESNQIKNLIVSRTPLGWTVEGTLGHSASKRKAHPVNSI